MNEKPEGTFNPASPLRLLVRIIEQNVAICCHGHGSFREKTRGSYSTILIAPGLPKTAGWNPGRHRDPFRHLPPETGERDTRSAAAAGPFGDHGGRLPHRKDAVIRRVQLRFGESR